MRKISEKATKALLNGETFKKDNTLVKDGAMYFHGNKIAWIERKYNTDRVLYYTQFGWPTRTTHNRLNTLALIAKHDVRFFKDKNFACMQYMHRIMVDIGDMAFGISLDLAPGKLVSLYGLEVA